MNRIIVFYHANYSSNLAIDGFRIFNSRQEFEDTLTMYLGKYPKPKIYVDTEIVIKYDNEENFLRSFCFKFISEEEYKMIKKIFEVDYGFFPNLEVEL